MNEMFATLLTIILFQTSVEAADKIRISMTGFAGQFMTFPLAQKRGFLKKKVSTLRSFAFRRPLAARR